MRAKQFHPGSAGELTRSGGNRLAVASPKMLFIERCSDAKPIEFSTETINLPGEDMTGTPKAVVKTRRYAGLVLFPASDPANIIAGAVYPPDGAGTAP